MKRLALLALPLATIILFGCGEEKTPLCKAVDDNRSAYRSARSLDNAIARDAATKKAMSEGLGRLENATKVGSFSGWKAEVKSVSTDLKGLGVVKLTLPCDATLSMWRIAPGSDVFNDLASLKVGKTATIDGVFIAALDGSKSYEEMSLTDGGKMTDPEFIVRLTSIKH